MMVLEISFHSILSGTAMARTALADPLKKPFEAEASQDYCVLTKINEKKTKVVAKVADGVFE
jgi:hypothetical protein